MIETAAFDTKPYDREYLARAPGAERVAWRFHEFRLSAINGSGRGVIMAASGIGASDVIAATVAGAACGPL